ncbi:DUF4129 domain-containing protein [Paenarthrobacter sp. DKR-5]|uniref:DUF4129 domain-containing protein n=1 Tax=Paenarthrobacter sp. DKR-5 TaxID=2835535 RepID=UPI001BDC5D6A|nr:DUF4129 domain-containing protein [Paenarthrobacter sp. DKR-5]MBT1002998.1 DUF4129 domain-containing protein [Paenarthrobacter sp. DKR-5]
MLIRAAGAVPCDIPVLPDAGEARRWAAEELAKDAYRKAKPGWVGQLLDQLQHWLQDALGSVRAIDPNLGAVLALMLVLVVAAVAVWLVRPRLNPRRSAPAAVFDEDTAGTAREHRARAARAAAAADFSSGVLELFRALSRAAEARDILQPRPGRTADETAAALGAAFEGHRTALNRAAEAFNAVRYGRATASQRDYEALRVLDAQLEAARPAYAAATGWMVPR